MGRIHTKLHNICCVCHSTEFLNFCMFLQFKECSNYAGSHYRLKRRPIFQPLFCRQPARRTQLNERVKSCILLFHYRLRSGRAAKITLRIVIQPHKQAHAENRGPTTRPRLYGESRSNRMSKPMQRTLIQPYDQDYAENPNPATWASPRRELWSSHITKTFTLSQLCYIVKNWRPSL